MKPKRYAVLAASIALITFCVWRSSVSPPRPVPENARESSKKTQTTEAAPIVRPIPTAPASLDAFWGRLEADLAFVLAEPDAIPRGEKVQVFIDSMAFNEIPAALQF